MADNTNTKVKKERTYKTLADRQNEIDHKIAYHLAQIETLKAKKENLKGSKSQDKIKATELLAKLAEKGLSVDDILASLEKNKAE